MNIFVSNRDPYPDFFNHYINESRGISSNDALTPQGIIEQTIDRMTCGAIKQQLRENYDEFKEKFAFNMIEAIDKKNDDLFSYQIPKHIEFSHLEHRVIITKNHFQAANVDTHTRIEIRPPVGDDVIFDLENDIISNFYTAELLVIREVISKDKIAFTANGALDLHGATFYKKDLSGINLSNANLRGVNFARTNLTNAKLDHACVDDADFTGANLENMDENNIDFSKAEMNGIPGPEMQSNAQERIRYSRCEKYRKDTIAEICKLVKNSYQRDQSNKRSAESDGLFRMTPQVEELKSALQAYNEKTLDVKKTSLSCLTVIIKNELTKLIALRAEVAKNMIANPKEAAKILRQETEKMIFVDKELLSFLLEFYSDAYNKAEDDNKSMFNKSMVLFSLNSIFLEPIILAKSLAPEQCKTLSTDITIMLKELLTAKVVGDDIAVPLQKKKQPINFIKYFLPLRKKNNKQ